MEKKKLDYVFLTVAVLALLLFGIISKGMINIRIHEINRDTTITELEQEYRNNLMELQAMLDRLSELHKKGACTEI